MVLLPEVFGTTGYLASFFINPQNVLFALAFLVPLILLYLIRPKPVNVAVPSLMFILSDMGKSNIRRFFRTIFRDILFIIQALAVILLALAMAKPFINVDRESLVSQSILIIDASASTAAFDEKRFDTIKETAQERLSNDNIIIISRANPVILDENDDVHLSAGRADEMIDEIESTDMEGDLPTALDLAAQYAGPAAKVVIVSDLVLSSLESHALIEAKIKLLLSKGVLVELIPIQQQGKNVGIIDAELNSQNATVDIKIQNFNEQPEEITLEYNGNQIVLAKNILAPEGKPGSLLAVSIPLAHGKSEITLKPNDDFATDNHYYVSIPDRDTINVLIITNDKNVQQSKLISALVAAGDQFTKINIEYGIPPKIPDLNHQIYIIKDVDSEFLLPGVIRDLHKRIDEGSILVVYNQPDLFSIDFQDNLPVAYKNDAQPLLGRQEILVNTSLGLMRGLADIGQADGAQLQRVSKTEDGVMHAYVATNDGPEPVIAHKRIGKGAVIYYGIKDQKTIDLDPQSYAVIWGRIIDYSIPDLRLLNVQTGTLISALTKNINTPMGKKPSPVLAIKAGFYQAGPTTTIAANLYPLHTSRATTTSTNVQYESFISRSANISAKDATEQGETTEEIKVPEDLSVYVIIAGIIIMIFELIYVKFRGDL